MDKRKKAKQATADMTHAEKRQPDKEKSWIHNKLWTALILSVAAAVVGYLGVTGRLQGYTKYYSEHSQGILEDQKLYDSAKDQTLINSLLEKSWYGLRTGIRLQIDRESSIILRDVPDNGVLVRREINATSLEDQTHPRADNATSLEDQTHPRADNDILDLDPIDLGPFIRRVLQASENTFLIVDGMKGCGKSTAMLLLCSHVQQQGRAAIYLKLSGSKNIPENAKTLALSFINDPTRFETLAEHYKKRGELVIVLDDFHTYLRNADEDQARSLVEELWIAASTYGARVIFTTSDYSLRESLTRLIRHSLRIRDIRLPPPSAFNLTKLIKEALVVMGTYNKSGNTDIDIEIYCEVVGTFRDVFLDYVRGTDVNSVRDVTFTMYETTLEEMKTALLEAPNNDYLLELAELLKRPTSGQLVNEKDMEHWITKCKANMNVSGECGDIQVAINRADKQRVKLNSILDGVLVNHTYTVETDEKKIASFLQARNVLRHAENRKLAVEFHSYVEEVAVRALLMTPTKDPQGHGRTETLDYLQTEDTRKYQEEVRRVLKRT